MTSPRPFLASWASSLGGGPTDRPSPGRGVAVTLTAPHVRDRMSVRRAMNCVIVALVPCILFGVYNTGMQTNDAMATVQMAAAPGWRGAVIDALGLGYDPTDILASFVHGLLYFLPVLAVAAIVGSLWEAVFASVRGRATAEGFPVIALLFSLSLPPTVALWQVALGISFAIVIGKEVFGGSGKNFLNPTVTGLAFLYVSYPTVVSERAWSTVDGFTGATTMRLAAEGGLESVVWTGTTWMQSFLGLLPGPFGATSTLACLLGAVVLIYTRVASVRVMAGALAGMIATVLFFNEVGAGTDPFLALPWHWQLTLGSFAFGTVFLATDPVTGAMTNTGRWVYGVMVGCVVILIRVANSAHPDGVIFAVLFANIFAPLIDYLVVRANIRRRVMRGG